MRLFNSASLLLAANVVVAFELYGDSFGVPGVNATYDYVVVGGGTAGLTIAARLAQDGRYAVAVIEAGGFYQVENGNGCVIPALAPNQDIGPDPVAGALPLIDWGFVTTPQTGALGRSVHYARGKTLGGSSARHFMVYHRATTGSHQLWADQVGDQSYTLPNFMKYLKRSVHFTPPNTAQRFRNSSVEYNPSAFDNSIYNQGQPLQVAWPNYAAAFMSWLQKGMNGLGIRTEKNDFQSGVLDGNGWPPSTIDPITQHRSSSQTSFMDLATSTTTIKVYTHTLAKQVLFIGNKTATGVLAQVENVRFTLTATKEVILSAGVFQSPQLLMVSGVGPRETLEQYGINVVIDLPGVGQNMWDQPLFGVTQRVAIPTGSELINNATYAAAAFGEFLQDANGPLAQAVEGVIAFERISASQPSLLKNSTISALKATFPRDWPEVEYVGQNGYLLDPGDGTNYASIDVSLNTPFSRGNVTISSKDASDPPVINPNWLTAPEDIDMAVAAMRRLREIWSHMGNITLGEVSPGANITTDEQILGFVRASVLPIWHAAATCKMGKASDKMAVIDSKAKVYGVTGLRVVDASSFPFLPPGHPQSIIYALAEKIADDMKSGN